MTKVLYLDFSLSFAGLSPVRDLISSDKSSLLLPNKKLKLENSTVDNSIKSENVSISYLFFQRNYISE